MAQVWRGQRATPTLPQEAEPSPRRQIHLLGHSLGHGHGGHSAGLRDANDAVVTGGGEHKASAGLRPTRLPRSHTRLQTRPSLGATGHARPARHRSITEQQQKGTAHRAVYGRRYDRHGAKGSGQPQTERGLGGPEPAAGGPVQPSRARAPPQNRPRAQVVDSGQERADPAGPRLLSLQSSASRAAPGWRLGSWISGGLPPLPDGREGLTAPELSVQTRWLMLTPAFLWGV